VYLIVDPATRISCRVTTGGTSGVGVGDACGRACCVAWVGEGLGCCRPCPGWNSSKRSIAASIQSL